MRIRLFILLLFSGSLSFGQGDECWDHVHPYQHLHSDKLFKSTSGLNVDITHTRLSLRVDPYIDEMSGSVRMEFKALNSLNTVSLDFTDKLFVDSIISASGQLSFNHSGGVITIQTGSLSVGSSSYFEVFYHGNPTNNPNQSYDRVDSRPQNDHPIIWTLSQPYGASDWWPCKDGLSDKIDSLDLFIQIPKGNKAAGNGKLVDEIEINDSQVVYHWKHRYPIATYLVAFAVTNYEEFTDWVYFSSGDSLPILNYIFPEYIPFGREPAKETVRMMHFFDSLFGSYPFMDEKYGHAQFLRGGGMEHQTMSFMVDWNFGLVAHELAHQWFGDMVTCGSWSDLWLNEGFATYLTLLCYDGLLSRNDWIANNNHSRSRAMELTDQSVYVFGNDTLNVGRLFSSRTTYHKGAQILHMLRWQMGDSAFYSGIRNYLNDARFNYGFARSEDLQFHLEQSSGIDLQEFMNDWLYGEAYPEFTVIWNTNEKGVQVHLKQTSLSPMVDHYEAPVEILLTNQTDSMYFRLESDQNDTTFQLEIDFIPDSLFFDPNYWILAKSTVIRANDIQGALRLYPNPASDLVEVSFGNRSLEKVFLYSVDGKLIDELIIQPGINKIQYDLSGIVPGVYFVEGVTGDFQSVARLVKY